MKDQDSNREQLKSELLDPKIIEAAARDESIRSDVLASAEKIGILKEVEKRICEAKQKPGEILLRPLADFEEREADFLIPNRIPRGQITILGGEGGSGKTFIWVDLVAAITSGGKCLLSEEVPFEIPAEKRKVIIFNAEDDIERVLKARLRLAGAVEENILTLSLADRSFSEIKFDSPKIEGIIQRYQPALIVFDPLQAFIPPETNMGARNAMRACLNPLIGLGEKYDVTFIIAMHVNKQSGAWGRKRLADSSDMWDIARSVLMVGRTLDGDRYISHEKNNYGQQAQTILFTIEEDRVKYVGISSKKDQDFIQEYYQETRSAPAKEYAENMILSYLMEHEGEDIEIGTLDDYMEAAGISKTTLKRTKTNLKKEGKIRYTPVGGGEFRKWYISITQNKKAEY